MNVERVRHPNPQVKLRDPSQRVYHNPTLGNRANGIENPVKWNLINHDLRSVFITAMGYISHLTHELNFSDNQYARVDLLIQRISVAQQLQFTRKGTIKHSTNSTSKNGTLLTAELVKPKEYGFSTDRINDIVLTRQIADVDSDKEIASLGDRFLDDFVSNPNPKSQKEVKTFFVQLYHLIGQDILTFVYELERNPKTSSEHAKEIKMIQQVPERLKETLALIDIGSINWQNRVNISPSQLFQEICDVFAESLKDRGLEIRKSETIGVQDTICTHPTIRNVIHNLLYNAIKQAPRGSCIYVSDLQTRELIAFVVANAGNGIRRDMIPKIFQLGVSETGSTGLGLWFSRLAVEKNGGILQVLSGDHPNSGAAFYFVLPKQSLELPFRIAPVEVVLEAQKLLREVRSTVKK